ncbi:carbonic anhydrase/acetyltransferase-like protein (isoleucine patch superfamily) [Spinactinospora alkalitolerans]|uniref:Carbonic anhydrase/acetyltransferase-like protein (Isoleucine patch superfamily) n=1 Tax=Spinactinospora alkalitolerans TaxID=687207 RepID=A0A852TQC9_9ACTN|nr:gamma carbonic anhydrase family protein [Spinactinospora alkalitolerans]NYE45032.1 carbonic anhydrase/acetyltransferase-like protein (isoleucine patch superfamily) [Spinactinospora alkalitolerans]
MTGPRVGDAGFGEPAIHPDAWIAPGAVVVGRVRIGAQSSVWYGSVLRADTEDIVVGDLCDIQDQCGLHSDPGEPALLADRVSLGHKAMVHGAVVEEGALIGIGAIVLGGARVGAGALVAAGALVPPGKTVPPGTLWAGVPGKVIRELTDADRAGFADTPEKYAATARLHRDVRWR